MKGRLALFAVLLLNGLIQTRMAVAAPNPGTLRMFATGGTTWSTPVASVEQEGVFDQKATKRGFSLALGTQLALRKHLSFGTELRWIERGFFRDDFEFTLRYLMIPVYAMFHAGPFSVYGGAYTAFGVGALLVGVKAENKVQFRATSAVEWDNSNYEKRDLGLLAGFQVDLSRTFFIGARLYEGYTNILKNGDGKVRMRTVEAQLGVAIW